MKRLKQIIEGSFSLRISLYILLVATLVFVLAFYGYFYQAKSSVKEEAMEQAQVKLDNTILQIDKVLNSVEIAVQNLSWLIADKLDDPNYMYELTQQLLNSNPHVVGSAIAFEPSYYPEKGILFSPYSYRTEQDEIQSKQLGTDDYEYHYKDWYQTPKSLGKPYWSEPYYDDGGADLIMTTFSLPLYDSNGEMYAVFTADLSLEWFTEKVNAIKLYPNSYNYMIGRGGTYLVNNRKEAILNESFFDQPLLEGNQVMIETGNRMIKGESGMSTFKRNGEEFYLFFAPVKSTGWSVYVTCLYSDIFAAVDGMRDTMIIISLIGLLLLASICYFTIRKLTTPLTHFAESATEIAQGNFMAILPDIKSKDEMKTLHHSFGYMQKSLVAYIDELKRTTAGKERIESELRIARNIQMGMVPKIFPPFPERNDVNLFAKLIPAKEVGGDLYDFFIKENKLYFIIGDVSGKGVPASLVMAVTCRLFRTVASHLQTPAEIVTALNDALAESNESNMFCTFFIGILDLETGFLQYCNAGHNAPVILSPSGDIKFIDVERNLPLGLFEEFSYLGQECTIENGTTIFLYTDGVTEAENIEKALYSNERLLQQLSLLQKNTPQTITDGILTDIKNYVAEAEQSDDITIMCLYYSKPTTKDAEKKLVLKNEINEINKLTMFVNDLGKELNLNSELIFNFNLILEEAISNVILYAYPKEEQQEIVLTATKKDKNLIFVLTDSGKEFDPTQTPDTDITLSAEDRQIGGLGIFLIRQIMDKVEYQRIDGKNVLTLSKILDK